MITSGDKHGHPLSFEGLSSPWEEAIAPDDELEESLRKHTYLIIGSENSKAKHAISRAVGWVHGPP